MLIELRVKNFGIIEEINWSLDSGLNVITGETGAGKSLVIDAVAALLAGRTDDEAIRYGAAEAHLEGVFALPKGQSLSQVRELLAENGLEDDGEILVILCEFRKHGRDVFRVNRHTVPRGMLTRIGRFLLDIYGQDQHMSLLNKEYQLDFLDSYARTVDLRHSFSTRAAELARVEHELKAIVEEEKDIARREEFLRFQIDEIWQAELREGEEEELEAQRTVLASTEKLKAFSYEAYQAIYGGEKFPQSVSTLDKLNEALQAMKKLVELDATLKQEFNYLDETVHVLEEVARDIRAYSDRLEYDPKQIEAVELRLGLISNLKGKYGQTITEILGYLQKAESQLEEISHSTEKRARREETRSYLIAEMGSMASELSKARTRAAGKLVTTVKGELKEFDVRKDEVAIAVRLSVPPYPHRMADKRDRGMPITIPNDLSNIYLADVFKNNGEYFWSASDGVIAKATGVGKNVREAKKAAEKVYNRIHAPGLQYRNDIGDSVGSAIGKLKAWGYLPGESFLKRLIA